MGYRDWTDGRLEERLFWQAGSGRRLELELTLEEAVDATPAGCDAGPSVSELASWDHVKVQLAKWAPDDVRAELAEYGAWDEEALADDASNVLTMLWLACADMVEDAYMS